jgi:hypothetical protein
VLHDTAVPCFEGKVIPDRDNPPRTKGIREILYNCDHEDKKINFVR